MAKLILSSTITNKLHDLFGQLLRNPAHQIRGDYAAGKALVENYGVKVNKDLHKEVLERTAKLTGAPYSGFINPKLIPVFDSMAISLIFVWNIGKFHEANDGLCPSLQLPAGT